MAIVSISEASRLTKKSRTTKHRYIKEGKLSTCSDGTHKIGIDVSELLRVFGEIKSVQIEHEKTDHNEHHVTQTLFQDEQLKLENGQLKRQIELLQDHVNSLKQAMLLLENKSEPLELQKKLWWKFWK